MRTSQLRCLLFCAALKPAKDRNGQYWARMPKLEGGVWISPSTLLRPGSKGTQQGGEFVFVDPDSFF